MADKQITRKIVFNKLQDEIKTIKRLFKEDDYQENEEYREPLSIEKTIEYRILLSWGGPEDGFKLRFRNDELISGVYYRADWGEYEEVELNDEEGQLVFDFYMFGELPE